MNEKEKLELLCDYTGDTFLSGHLFWDMFDLLSKANQKRVVKWAENAVKEQYNNYDLTSYFNAIKRK
jgi:hypothetical protein